MRRACIHHIVPPRLPRHVAEVSCRRLLCLTRSRTAGEKPRKTGYRPLGPGDRQVTLGGRIPEECASFGETALI